MTGSFFEDFLGTSLGFQPELWGLVKLGILLGLFLYLGFAIMVVRQVDLMSRALDGTFSGPFKILAWLYLGAAVVVFILAIFIL
jgi:hypothetical protein